jgi:hypothetical protein
LDGSVETNVAVSSLLSSGYTSDQVLRAQVFGNAVALRLANPGVVYLLYGPTNSGSHADGDRIWDSRLHVVPGAA